MLNQNYRPWAIGVFVAAIAWLVTPARADFTVGRNLAFNSPGNNPWAPGPAFTWDPDPYTLLNIPYTHVDIPPIDANPTEAVLGVLGDIFGVDIPDIGVASLKVGGSVSGSAFVGVDLYATLGELDVKYPGHASLDVQTNGPLNGGVTSRQTYTIGSSFQPGVNTFYNVSPLSLVGLFGPGYNSPQQWAGLSYNTFSQPTFSTTPPWASASLIAKADVHAGVYAQVSAAFGAFKGRLNYNFGGPVGGTVVEIDPSGLYVYGEDTGLFNLTQPINIPIAGVGTATVRYPDLGIPASVPDAMNSAVLRGTKVSEVFSIDADVEKLIPVLGPILHNSLGPISYDLAHIGLKPKVSLYQDLAFVPDPRVRLQFSEMVLVNGNLTREAEFPLGQPLNWTPIFSNSDHITIVPEYIMKNTFYNVTGVALDVDITFDALGFDASFLPIHVGPLIGPQTATLNGPRIPLYEPTPWELNVKSIVGSSFTLPKYNVVNGLEDIHLTVTQFLNGSSNGPATFGLLFEKSVGGGPAHQFQATVDGYYTAISYPNLGGESTVANVLTANQDVIFIDPVTSEQFNLGRVFGLYNTDLSGLFPAASPVLNMEDPAHPGQFLPPLSAPYLDAISYTPLDTANHPILGHPTNDQTNGVTEVEYSPAIADLRNGGHATTLMVQSIEVTPDGDAEYGPLPKAFMNNSGAVVVQGSREPFSPAVPQGPGLYLVQDDARAKLARPGDPIPGGGTLQFDVNPAFIEVHGVSATGAVAFHANGGTGNSPGIYRGRATGIEPVARHGQPVPGGTRYFNFTGQVVSVAINSSDDVAFVSNLSSVPGVFDFDSIYAVFRTSGASILEIARVGQIAPIPSGTQFQSIDPQVDINDSGSVAFTGRTNTSSSRSVFRGNGQSLVAIAVFQSQVAPGWAFGDGYNLRINNAGQVAFLGTVYQPGVGNFRTGVYRGNGGPLTEITRVGFTAPDLDGSFSSINQSMGLGFNEAGQVAFLAHVSGAADYDGLFRAEGSVLQRIARSGQAAPNGDGVFQSFATAYGDDVQLNNRGHLAFHSNLTSTANDQGIFVYDGANIVQVARKGESLAGSTVVSIGAPSLNDEMQVAYVAHLADGRDVAARFEPTIYWHNAGSGNWGTPANWSLGIEPIDPYDVRIIAESPLTVTGPAVNRIVKSLAIGGSSAAAATLDLVGATTLTATNGTTIAPGGVLSGYGALAGEVTSNGVLRVGGSGASPTSIMSLLGDVTLEPGNKLLLDVKGMTPGAQFDRLAVDGELHLAGELAMTLGGGFNPSLGNSFQILSIAGNFSGQFDMKITQLPALAAGLGWLVRYHAHDVTLQVIPKLVGDFNANGVVGSEDYDVWSANFGQATNLSADADGDHDVDGFDFLVWQGQFGASSPFAAGSEVPEPTMWWLVTLGVLGISVLRPLRRCFR